MSVTVNNPWGFTSVVYERRADDAIDPGCLFSTPSANFTLIAMVGFGASLPVQPAVGHRLPGAETGRSPG
ncbi:MAG TPA: hypothetical protein VEK82_15945 [Stellaceae bacterium]|nr:hypothetical protein [Stellaceae bacterium]